MSKKDVFVSESELVLQREFSEKIKKITKNSKNPPKAFVRTFGCQQNVADSQRIKGMLKEMGYTLVDSSDGADFIIFNTCAVREHAEDRVIGNIGALKHHKRQIPGAVIALCGCMMQQEHIAQRIKKSFPHVDLVFGTHALHRLPEMVYNVLQNSRRLFEIADTDGVIAEGVPYINDGGVSGFIPIMYGCNNFCTYCVVPHVRGRERSRRPENILADLKDMLSEGVRTITLLGQNVNSYDGGVTFAKLLRMCNDIPGEFVIRFMTSHPKDVSDELLEAMSECEKVEKHLHLPVQSGSTRVLAAMNRGYSREDYLKIVKKARSLMPDIMLTSDIIIGFPGETYKDARETFSLVEEVRFESLFTFIYSKRKGTPAAELPDDISREEKGKWFKELLDIQEKISEEINQNRERK